MGLRITDEDGSLLYEFRDGLGAILLHRLLLAAKFRADADYDIVLNEHVAELGKALRQALPATTKTQEDDDDVLRSQQNRLVEVFNHHVSTGALRWPSWRAGEKKASVRDVICAPFKASDQFVADFVEDRDGALDAWRRALTCD